MDFSDLVQSVTKFLGTVHNFRKESLSSLHSDIDFSTNYRDYTSNIIQNLEN